MNGEPDPLLDQRRRLASTHGMPRPEPCLPVGFGRTEEEALLDLCATGSLDVQRWLAAGPRWFMAGVAVLMARGTGPERERLLLLAEALCPGMSSAQSFGRWLEISPVKPARFLPILNQRRRTALARRALLRPD